MTLQDLDTVVALEGDAHHFPWSRNKIWECLDVGNDCWVCECASGENSNAIMAYAVVSRVLDEAGLLNICVAKGYQNRGIGRTFMDFLVNNLGSSGIARLHLEVRSGNARAIRLYESLGFTRNHIRKAYYPALDGREDALVYSLELSDS